MAPAMAPIAAETAMGDRTRSANTTRSPSTISAHSLTRPRPVADRDAGCNSMTKEHTADSKNEAASNAMASGAVSTCTSPPASAGPAVLATEVFKIIAPLAWIRLSRSTRAGSNDIDAVSKNSVMVPVRKATAYSCSIRSSPRTPRMGMVGEQETAAHVSPDEDGLSWQPVHPHARHQAEQQVGQGRRRQQNAHLNRRGVKDDDRGERQ